MWDTSPPLKGQRNLIREGVRPVTRGLTVDWYESGIIGQGQVSVRVGGIPIGTDWDSNISGVTVE